MLIVFEKNEKGKLMGNVDAGELKRRFDGATVAEKEAMVKNVKALRLHFSLMGETSPQPSPLSPDFSMDNQTTFYRYDWIVGASPFAPFYNKKWNWFKKIGKRRAMIIQLLMDSEGSGCGVSESNAFLMGLLPSKDTRSIFEKNLPKLGNSLEKVSNIAGEYSGLAANLVKASAVVSNFVVSDDRGIERLLGLGRKNWFLYRFLDHTRKCCAVEWNISRNVLHQYGSALRGSILLAFHGKPKPGKPMKLLLRPRLHFGAWEYDMSYGPPEEQLEQENPVELSINPESG